MINRRVLTGSLLLLLSAAACATAQPPRELLDARAAYNHAQQGSTARMDPADLHIASKALKTAEESFERDGDTAATRDLAYIATRRVEIADAKANTVQASAAELQAVTTMHATRADQLSQANQQLAQQNQQLTSERMNREAAEKRAAQNAADLLKAANAKQEPRGMVITLSGGDLFASGKSEIMPRGQTKLNSIAEALGQQDSGLKTVVEGHTDSQGTVSSNQELSQRRAQSVRDYLVAHGAPSDRVTAAGLGSTRPIADNNSPEGRANNRRVEIVMAAK